MFAEVDGNGWAVIIAAIGVVLSQIVQMILSYLREQRTTHKLNTIEKQTNGEQIQKTAIATAQVVAAVAEKTAENLVNTASAAAAAAAASAASAASASQRNR